MVEGFVPQAPEEALDKRKDTAKPQEVGEQFSQEAYKPRELERVGDTQGDKPKDPLQVYQAVFRELGEAKQGMLQVNEIISKGGGPYAKGDGFKAYQGALDNAQQHYTKARIAADSFLYVCDQQGNPLRDSTGNPIPSKENVALRQQLAGIEQNLQQMSQDQSPAGREKMKNALDQANQIKDILRASGYARANNAFALMFHSGDLQGKDREAFAKTGMQLIVMAAEFDPSMRSDANFQKHYDAAMSAVMGMGTSRPPIDQSRPPIEQRPPVEQPRPGPVDQTRPGSDQRPPVVDQTKVGDQIPGVANAKLSADGNQYYIDYRGLHVPTWTSKNPDGSASQPFAGVREVRQQDGSVKQEQVQRADGMLSPVKDAQGKVLGVDGKPLMDANGLRRLNEKGLPVPAQFDSSDPFVMKAQLERSITGPLDDKTRAEYNRVIESADKLDRVAFARALEKNEEFMKSNPDAVQWEGNNRQLRVQLDKSFNELGQFRNGLNKDQLDALNKMWDGFKPTSQDPAKISEEIDKWLENPANNQSKAALSAAANWKDIKAKYAEFLSTDAKVTAMEAELAKNPALLDKVRKVRAADAMNQELANLFASSVDVRRDYAAKLLEQESVKKYMAVADKNSADAKAMENDANLQEARRMLAELAKCKPDLIPRMDATAKALGMDLSRAAAPAEVPPKVEPPKDQTKVEPAKDPTKVEPPKDQTKVEPPKDQTKVEPAKPEGQTEVQRLSEAQAGAPQFLNNTFLQYRQATEGATKPMKAEDFAKVAPEWEKGLEAYASIKPEQIAAYESQAQQTYAEKMRMSVAMQKLGKKSLAELQADDLKLVSVEELRKAMTDAAVQLDKVNTDLDAAQKALKPDEVQKYVDAEKKFNTSMESAQKEADAKLQAARQAAHQARVTEINGVSADLAKALDELEKAQTQDNINKVGELLKALPADQKAKVDAAQAKFVTTLQAATEEGKGKVQAAYDAAYKTKLAEQKSINETLGKAIDAREAFLNDPSGKGAFASEFSENIQMIDRYKHLDEAKVQYAQALALQGGEENKAKANKLISEAIKNPEIAKLLQNTQDGAKLLKDLSVKTADMVKQDEEQDKLFPELKLQRQALEILNDKSKDPKQAWQEADNLFKQAEAALDKEIIEKGQGKDVAESMAKIQQNIDVTTMNLGNALDDFKNGRRKLPGPDGPAKDNDTKIVQDAVSKMSRIEMIQALRGQKGQQAQAMMYRVLTDSERASFESMQILALKAQGVAAIRMQHALKASEYGFAQKDDAAKAQAKALVESIATVDPATFSQSPEVLGALKQAQQGRQMDIADGKASTIAFSEAAKDTISKTQMGLVDYVVPGVSLIANTGAVAATGHYVSEVPVVGGLFGGSKEATAKLVDQLAMAQLSNEAEAKAQRDQVVNDGKSQVRGLLGDVSGVASSFATGWGVNKGITYLAGEAPVPWYIKAPAVGLSALAVGGLTNNAVSGHDLLASRGYIRNTVAAGTTYAAIKGLQYLPGNSSLSVATTEKLGIAPGTTGQQLSRMLSAEAAAAGEGRMVQFAKSFGDYTYKLPLNMTPLRIGALAEGASRWNPMAQLGRLQYAGWGGERTAQLLADGLMAPAEFKARQFAAKTLGTFAVGYTFGAANKGAAIYTGEHLDGKKYNTFSDYWQDMNTAGLQSGLASSLFVPIVGKALVPQGIQDKVGTGVTNLFGRLPGVDAPAAASAFGTASLMYFRPTTDAGSRLGESLIYSRMYSEGTKRAQELREQASKQLQGQNPGAAPPEKK